MVLGRALRALLALFICIAVIGALTFAVFPESTLDKLAQMAGGGGLLLFTALALNSRQPNPGRG